jgi:parallel beta-helix repeat protein
MLLGVSGPAAIAQSPAPSVIASSAVDQPASYQTLYVNAETGNDGAEGFEDQPLQTVTHALEIAPPNTVIVLAPGRYNQASGEVFPLQLKSGVTIQGAPGSRDRTAIIEGGGNFDSPARSQQNAAIIAADRAGIAQVAISNPDGYGVWIESASPTILESAFVGNRQTGIYVVSGSPRVEGSYFSGNQVAGLIVFGTSSASIQSNIFDGTGDAIRLVDGAAPEIVGNRMTNNDAGLVLVGQSNPLLRDNEIVGNRQDDVVEVVESTRDIEPAATLVASVVTEEVAEEVEPEQIETTEVVAETEASDIEAPDTVANLLSTLPERESAIALNEAADDVEADAVAVEENADLVAQAGAEAVADLRPAGSPGAALEALQAGLALAPRAVTGDNPEESVLEPRGRRDRPERRLEESAAPPPVNNNRLAVPNSAIPLGSGDSVTSFLPPGSSASASRAQALGLYYRVFVEASDPYEQDEIRSVIPDAFRTSFDGRTVMQVGAFPTEEEAEDRKELLEDNDFDVRVEYMP